MPRHPQHRNPQLSTYNELRNLRLAVQLRAEQVKLRRLEWDTQTLALPRITPLPGDGELQVRKPLTDKDIPRARPPKMPEFQPGMPHELYQVMLELYMNDVRYEERRDPYNKLASVTAQAILEAAQAREDAKREKEKAQADKLRRARDAAQIERDKKMRGRAERPRGI